MAHPLLFDATWSQQFKYESAEAFYQQMVAKSGSCQVAQSCHDTVQSAKSAANKSQESNIKSEIAKTRQDILKALNEGDKTGSCAVDQQVVQRISALETENKNLKNAAQDLTALVKKLEARVVVLEKGTSASAPSAGKQQEQKPAKDKKKEDSDSDFNPFGNDDSASEDEATKAALAAYKAKKSNKPVLVAKSSLLIDVKPWDDETDMTEMERLVRTVEMDGLLWGASKLVPVGYGIKKLQINAVIEDDKVSTDDLEEKITAFEDLVQSMDIAAFNKI